jgi:hypothetical protein
MIGNRMGEDLMTRRQVAYLFRVTSSAVAAWARRGRLPEVRDESGKPRYRRADVEALFRNGVSRGRNERAAAAGSPGASDRSRPIGHHGASVPIQATPPEGDHRHDRAARPIQDSCSRPGP